MAHESAIPRRRHGEPVGEVPAVARAGRHLARRVDELESLERRIRCLVQIVGRPFERIELDILREFLAVPGRAGVVGHQHDKPRDRGAEEVRIPA